MAVLTMVGGLGSEWRELLMYWRELKNRISGAKGAEGTVAVLFSLVAHLALLLILACWVFVSGTSSHGLTVAGFSEPAVELPAIEISPESASLNDFDVPVV